MKYDYEKEVKGFREILHDMTFAMDKIDEQQGRDLFAVLEYMYYNPNQIATLMKRLSSIMSKHNEAKRKVYLDTKDEVEQILLSYYQDIKEKI